MRTHLQFRSSQFEIVPGEDEQTNPGIYGLRLAEFMTQQLNSNGYTASFLAEDWGWCVMLKHPDFESFVGCSSCSDNEWQIQISPDKPVIRRFFKKFDTVDWVESLADTIEKILTSNGEAQGLRWSNDAE
jgi:hypothetical protein